MWSRQTDGLTSIPIFGGRQLGVTQFFETTFTFFSTLFYSLKNGFDQVRICFQQTGFRDSTPARRHIHLPRTVLID